MSRGPGYVERRIRAAFYAEPDRVFSTGDLCEIVYGAGAELTRSRRNTICRAARKIVSRMAWEIKRTQDRGRPALYLKSGFATSFASRETPLAVSNRPIVKSEAA